MTKQTYTCLKSVGPELRGCGLKFGTWEELQEHEKTHFPSKRDLTDEDAANIGRALMERLPAGYSWSDCPTEIVTDLLNEIDDLKPEVARLRNDIQELTCGDPRKVCPNCREKSPVETSPKLGVDDERVRLLAIEMLAKEMIQEMRLTPDGLIVRERPDKSDAHYRLCAILWPKGAQETKPPRDWVIVCGDSWYGLNDKFVRNEWEARGFPSCREAQEHAKGMRCPWSVRERIQSVVNGKTESAK